MNHADLEQHLSQMSTRWTALYRAHGESDAKAAQTRGEILQRYGPAIYRYLLAATRDQDMADELYQEFALKLMRGDFKHADPQRGRFRDYLKTTLYHLVNQARRRPRVQPLTTDIPEPDSDSPLPAEDEAFLYIWREALMQRTWTALHDRELSNGQPLCTVLRFRTDHPELNSQRMAEQLSQQQGRSLSAEWVRKWILRARLVFAELLVEDVAQSLVDLSPESLEEELRDLGLLDHCQAAAKNFWRQHGKP